MDTAFYIGRVLFELFAAYLCGVALVVTSGLFLSRFLARNDSMDEFQAKVFGSFRPTPARRLIGHCTEIAIVAFDMLLRCAWVLRLLPHPRDPGSGTPVVLLPGYWENGGALWWMSQRLQRRGFRPHLLDFPSTFSCIDDNVTYLRTQIDALLESTGAERVAIVAHSMGGLIARSLLLTDSEHRVLTLVALASPFRGTHMARFGALLLRHKSAIDLCPQSPYAGRFLPSAAASVPIRVIIGEQETIVSPPWSSVLPGGETHVLSLPVGHDAPLYLPEAYFQVEAWLLQDGVRRAETFAEHTGRATAPE
jgi:pimeloyl-ACP methyl ester carboxylesterase